MKRRIMEKATKRYKSKYIKKDIYDEVIKLVNNKYGNNINFTVEDYYRVVMSEIININN